jgi:hypothetical protein
MKEAEKKELKEMAMMIAMVVRNGMEDFHCKHLTDKQMKELNPLIRNSIYTALYMLILAERTEPLENIIKWTKLCIPNYWEDPELNKDFTEALKGDFKI